MIALASASLVLYGNAAALVFSGAVPGGSAVAAGLGVVFAALVLGAARRAGLSFADIGLTTRDAVSAALAGAAVAVIAVAGALMVLRNPPLVAGPVAYGPVAAFGSGDLAFHLLVLMPLAVVLPEEVAFRGWLLAALRRRYDVVRAVVISSAVFMLWHAVIVTVTVENTTLASSFLFSALGAAIAFAAVFAGGVAFALLRLWTGHLAAPIAAHWGFNAALLVGLWWLR